jgi:FkbM family methyltransferase
MHSNSQLYQDLFVLFQTKEKEHGYFVEFGGADGLTLSNTLLLERKYSWTGIIAEPGIIWHETLLKNRVCKIDKRCVWNKDGVHLTFKQTIVPELSTIDSFSKCDNHKDLRNDFISYDVETTTLENLLSNAGAPSVIDYLSIDTEGSEFEILSAFNFDRYVFKIITVEHNYTSMREKINALLVSKGYKRVFEEVSFFDDWYVYDTNNLK